MPVIVLVILPLKEEYFPPTELNKTGLILNEKKNSSLERFPELVLGQKQMKNNLKRLPAGPGGASR